MDISCQAKYLIVPGKLSVEFVAILDMSFFLSNYHTIIGCNTKLVKFNINDQTLWKQSFDNLPPSPVDVSTVLLCTFVNNEISCPTKNVWGQTNYNVENFDNGSDSREFLNSLNTAILEKDEFMDSRGQVKVESSTGSISKVQNIQNVEKYKTNMSDSNYFSVQDFAGDIVCMENSHRMDDSKIV